MIDQSVQETAEGVLPLVNEKLPIVVVIAVPIDMTIDVITEEEMTVVAEAIELEIQKHVEGRHRPVASEAARLEIVVVPHPARRHDEGAGAAVLLKKVLPRRRTKKRLVVRCQSFF